MEGRSILERIEESFQGMSKSHKKIASFVLNHFDHVAFMTAAQLGRELEVSESTVVRFASGLGLTGYPEFQKALAICVRDRLSGEEKDLDAYHGRSRSEILTSVLRADAERLLKTMESVDATAFDLAVETVLKAETVYVYGGRKNGALAEILASYLNLIRKNVTRLSVNGLGDGREQLLYAGEKDCLISIVFSGGLDTKDGVWEFARMREMKVIAIANEMAEADEGSGATWLKASGEKLSIVDSLVAPLSLINALIVALVLKCPGEVNANVKLLEGMHKDVESSDGAEEMILTKDMEDE